MELMLDNLREEVKRIVEPYLKRTISIHKDNIVSIVLYGSARGKDFVVGRSNVNLIIIFKKLDFSVLESSLKVIRYGLYRRIPAPLYLSLEHIKSSKDAFPVEFLEITENHKTLYGEECFKDITIDLSNLRLFCERELKGKLIHLRESYLERGLYRKAVKHLMHASLFSLIPIFKMLIRLKHNIAPSDKREVISEICNLYNLDKEVFMSILEDKMGHKKIDNKKIDNTFARYLSGLERLSDIVDKI